MFFMGRWATRRDIPRGQRLRPSESSHHNLIPLLSLGNQSELVQKSLYFMTGQPLELIQRAYGCIV